MLSSHKEGLIHVHPPFHLQSHHQITAMETEMKSLQESAGLFEVSVPEFKQLKACRREVGMLKSLWDMVTLVQSSFSAWNTTLWKDINVENMEIDCKKFVKVGTVMFLCMNPFSMLLQYNKNFVHYKSLLAKESLELFILTSAGI